MDHISKSQAVPKASMMAVALDWIAKTDIRILRIFFYSFPKNVNVFKYMQAVYAGKTYKW